MSQHAEKFVFPHSQFFLSFLSLCPCRSESRSFSVSSVARKRTTNCDVHSLNKQTVSMLGLLKLGKAVHVHVCMFFELFYIRAFST